LFGHKQGSFTGAIKDNDGLFKKAANQILFLDEVHNLSLRVQEKLMTALQTENSGVNKGKFCFRRLGDSEESYVEFRPVFASNLKIVELKKKIMPDLYDRISQLVVEFPSIHESKLDLKMEFKNVWTEMDFKEYPIPPHSELFVKWLKRISLEGNYRTLQSIAINWHQGRLIEYEKKGVNFPEKEDEVFDFVRKQFSKFHAGNITITKNAAYNFRKGVSKKQMEKEYQIALYDWALSKDGYGNPTEAQKGLNHSRLSNPNKK
jgi:transcriptional regulator with AAA-type ATPase domain